LPKPAAVSFDDPRSQLVEPQKAQSPIADPGALIRLIPDRCLSVFESRAFVGLSKQCGKGKVMVTPLHDLTDHQVEDLSQEYPSGNHPVYGLNLPTEIERQERLANRRYILTAIVISAMSAFFSMVATIATLITIYVERE
jgi:hypothetical protein